VRLLGGNVLWLSLVSLLNDTASEMIYPLLPLFLVGTLGASTTLLGVIEGIAESVSSFLKLASGWLSDRLRRRKPLILIGYTIATVARPLIAIAGSALHPDRPDRRRRRGRRGRRRGRPYAGTRRSRRVSVRSRTVGASPASSSATSPRSTSAAIPGPRKMNAE
jgi:MFS family permease